MSIVQKRKAIFDSFSILLTHYRNASDAVRKQIILF